MYFRDETADRNVLFISAFRKGHYHHKKRVGFLVNADRKNTFLSAVSSLKYIYHTISASGLTSLSPLQILRWRISLSSIDALVLHLHVFLPFLLSLCEYASNTFASIW